MTIDNFEDDTELLRDAEKSTEEVYASGNLLDTFTSSLENTEHDSGSDSSDAEFDFDEALIQN